MSVTARQFVRHPELSLLCFAPYCVRDLVLCLWPLKQVVYTTQVGIYITSYTFSYNIQVYKYYIVNRPRHELTFAVLDITAVAYLCYCLPSVRVLSTCIGLASLAYLRKG